MSAQSLSSGLGERVDAGGQRAAAAMRHFLRSGVTYWGAMLVAGACNLVFNLLAARHLGPASYGVLAAIVALVNVFLIGASAVTRTATAVVASTDDRGVTAWILRRGTAAGVVVGIVAMLVVGALARPLAGILHMQHPVWIWIAAASLVPVAAGAVTTGVLQGLRAFGTSGGVNLTGAVLKLAALLLLLDAGLGITGAGVATLCEVTVIWIAALVILHRLYRGVALVAPAAGGATRALWTLPAAVTVARLIFFNLDILVARHYLSAANAGLFAALAVTGRMIAYGTGALPPVVYPYLVRHRDDPALASRYLFLCLLATAGTGAAAIAVLGLAPASVVQVLFGSQFASIAPYVAWYGLAFLLYSFMYVLLHYLLAMESWWVWVYAVGGGLLEMAALAIFHAGIASLTADEVGCFGLLFVLASVQTAVWLRRTRRAAAGGRTANA